ncbi:MAG: sulfatase-like hydrolase/transferase [Limisphaerales bacterium]
MKFVFSILLASISLIAAQKPNVILILADDLGYADLGAYGNRINRTPHLDRLAQEGIRFTDFHSNGANCSPTRAAILTGQYQQRWNIEGTLGEGAKGLSQKSITIAERLRAAGYTTGLMGKWHLGYQPDNSPLRHGFDEFVGHLHGATDYLSHVDRYGRMDWWHNEKKVHEKGHNTTLITKHSVRFIEEHRDRPFFLFISHSAIHFPWQTRQSPPHRRPGKRYESSKGKLGPHVGSPIQPIVRGMIEELDDSVGAIVAALKKHELDKSTLIFFTSDNGGIIRMKGVPINQQNRISDNTPWRGQKHGLYEGGHRVPAIAWWPGQINPGQSAATTVTTDLFPTILNLAGQQAGMTDGVDLSAHLLKQQPLPERTLFWRNGNSKAVRWKNWKLVRNHEAPFELYDLDQSPDEKPKFNQIEARKEIADDLLRRMRLWEESLVEAR